MDAGAALRALLHVSVAPASSAQSGAREAAPPIQHNSLVDEENCSSLADLSLSDSEPSPSPGRSRHAAPSAEIESSEVHGMKVLGVQQLQLQNLQQLVQSQAEEKSSDPQQCNSARQQPAEQEQPQRQPHVASSPTCMDHWNSSCRRNLAEIRSKDFAWLRALTREQRQALRRCTSPRFARVTLASFSGEGSVARAVGCAPATLLAELRRQTQVLLRKAMDVEEEIAQLEMAHAAQVAAVEEEHRKAKRRAKLQLLAHWAPHRTAAVEALTCEVHPSLRPAAAALAHGPRVWQPEDTAAQVKGPRRSRSAAGSRGFASPESSFRPPCR
eukprot:TRINITY_DN5608_c0_g1_i3.p1 TRINITY_DN5608_c0_g1~~TRINITY_DN5608_c0_g1_i3.p1  ORF type:complete len:328 (-),score=64.49 TRINITY_DN5608_c0_g1_i3:148-1131(-)